MRLDLGPAIEDVRTQALAAIDAACTRAWTRIEADQAGKNKARALKAEEAGRVLGGLLSGGTPMLSMEAGIRGVSRTQMARMVRDAAAAGDAKMQSIEQVRMEGKTAVRKAATVAAIRTARMTAESQADTL